MGYLEQISWDIRPQINRIQDTQTPTLHPNGASENRSPLFCSIVTKVNRHELAGAFGQRSPVKVQAHMVCCNFIFVAFAFVF